MALLGFEVVAYLNGWHFDASSLYFDASSLRLQRLVGGGDLGIHGAFDWFYSRWVRLRVEYLAPPLQFLTNACIILFLIQSLDRLILCFGCFWIRLKKIKPVAKVDVKDVEAGGFFPMVLVQIPMCNEKEVCVSSFLVLFCLLHIFSELMLLVGWFNWN